MVFDITVFGVRGRAEEKGMRGVREEGRQGRGGERKEGSGEARSQSLRKRPEGRAYEKGHRQMH